ncbi:hypothetical protein Hypma_015538 [Hypsizygus marmoreus]|uniref:Uncharacterized protein n=1 Tax=Hypsizygus marmoreus TaxID=39966 RepID=A0A369K545_HYPMA|nr:hypothetical protein Hypma_015538 [Hypsizygus marmoreus]
MQPYGNYPHYGQHPYQQPPYMGAGPSNGYPPFNYPPNPNYSYMPQYPDNREAPFIPPPPAGAGSATPRPKAHRRTATTPGAPPPVPLKSAMKSSTRKSTRTSAPEALTRQATYPPTMYNPPTIPRPPMFGNGSAFNQDPMQDFRPLHMFMVFSGNNELRIENILKPAMDELRASILPMWPDGVEADSQHGHDWVVKFRNNPWALQGPNAAIAWRIIVQLFTLFARRGFSFLATMNTGSPPPRLIFEVTPEDRTSQFFLAYFSQGGRRLTLIKPPEIIDDTLGSQLKAVLPRKITEDLVDDDLRVIEVKKRGGFGGAEVEPTYFLMHVLKILSDHGYNLVTTVPLGRRGPLGVRAGREMLVFRGSSPAET